MSSNELNCNNPKFLGEGGEGIIVRCDDDVNKQFVVKLANPNKVSPPLCSLENELENGNYINSPVLVKPILLLKTTNRIYRIKTKYNQANKYIGQENVIKYYNSSVIGLTSDNIQDIQTSKILLLNEDIKKAKPEEKNEIIRRKKLAELSIKEEINEALRKKCLVVVEYCDQGDLFSFIKNHPEYVSNPSLFKDIIYQIFCGLVYLYNKKVCHWDIKPENILVKTNPTYIKNPSQDSRKYLFKIADYGKALIDSKSEINEILGDNHIELIHKNRVVELINRKKNEHNLDFNFDEENLIFNKSKTDKPFKESDTSDIENLFESSPLYISPRPFLLTSFYRDMYAFVLTIYMILISHSGLSNKDNPNAIYQDTTGRLGNLPMSVLASKKKDHNYIYQYYKKNNNSRPAELLWKIARKVKDIEEKIESQSEALYYVKEPKPGDSSSKILENKYPTFYKPHKVIINVSNELYKELYEGIGELFETRVGKTLKKIHQRKIAAKTQKTQGLESLGSQASSNNNFDAFFEVPENIEADLLGKHVVFVNSSVTPSSTHRTLNRGQNRLGLAWNNNDISGPLPTHNPHTPQQQQPQRFHRNLSQRPSFSSHQPPSYTHTPSTARNTSEIPEHEMTTNLG